MGMHTSADRNAIRLTALQTSAGPRPTRQASALSRFRHRARIAGLSLTAALCVGVTMQHAHAQIGDEAELPIYVNDSREAQELAAEVDRLMRENRVSAAAAVVQRILEDHGTRLMALGDSRYIDATLWANQRLQQSQPLLDAYRQRFTPVAEHALGQNATTLTPGEPASVDVLLDVRRRFGMTRPGMEAALLLAGLDLERGDPDAATGLLASLATHPDQAALATRYWQLRGTAAALRSDAPAVEAAAQALREADAQPQARALEQLAANVKIPPRDPGTSGTRLADLGPPTSMEQPLWQVPLEGGAYDLVVSSTGERGRGGINDQQGPVITPVPKVSGPMVLINDGGRVLALDRWSGRERWVLDWSKTDAPIEIDATDRRAQWMLNAMRPLPDTRGIAARSGKAFAVMGYATAKYPNQAYEGKTASLAAIDLPTGELLWSRSVLDLDPEMNDVSFFGTPVTDGQRVYVSAHKTQQSGFADAYIFCLDAARGNLQWRLHLSSVALVPGNNRAGQGADMVLIEDRLFASDQLGTAAAVDARTGVVQWIRILAQGGPARRGRMITQRDIASPPVRVAAGLLVPVGAGSTSVHLVDPETGLDVEGLKERLEDPAFNAVSRIEPAGNDVIVIGRRIARLDGATLQTKWTHTPSRSDAPFQPLISEQYMIVASERQTTVLSTQTGKVLDRVQSTSGHATGLPGEVFMAEKTSVSGYMSWGHAYAQLMQQIEQQPLDPSPALALAHLGHRNSNEDGLLEGLAAAVAAVQEDQRRGDFARAEANREEIYNRMLAYAVPVGELSNDTRQTLFDRLAILSESADEEVRYHLAVGTFLTEMQRGAQAAGHFQAILLDPALADQPVQGTSVSRRASLEARQRLAALVQTQGQGVYRDFEARARNLYATLDADPASTADDWLALADQYPVARIAPRATLRAASTLHAQQDAAQAAHLYRQVYRKVQSDPELAATAAGGLAALYLDSGRPDAAVRWLKRVAATSPDLQPTRDGLPMTLSQWIAEIEAMPGIAAIRPVLRPGLGTPRMIEGQLVRPHDNAGRIVGEGLLVRRGNQLAMLDAQGEKIRWSAEIPQPDGALQLLMRDEDLTLVIQNPAGTMTAYDSKTGALRWTSGAVAELLSKPPASKKDQAAVERKDRHIVMNNGGVVVLQDRIRAATVRETPAAEDASDLLIGVSEAAVCVANRTGLIFAIDLRTGQTTWQRVLRVDEMLSMEVNDEQAVLLGARMPENEANSRLITVINLFTGEDGFAPIETQEEPLWVGLLPDGALITAMNQSVSAYDPTSGRRVWQTGIDGIDLVPRGWAGPGYIALADSLGGVMLFDPADGRSTGRVQVATGSTEERFDLVACDGVLLGVSGRGVTAFTPAAQVLWRDGLELGDGRITAAVAGDRTLGLLVGDATAAAFNADRRRPAARWWGLLNLDTGRALAVERFEGVVGLDVRHAVAGDGFIAVDAGAKVAILAAVPVSD